MVSLSQRRCCRDIKAHRLWAIPVPEGISAANQESGRANYRVVLDADF
jgi:hypothetical protein